MQKVFPFKAALFCLLQIFTAFYSFAQEATMKHYTVKDGLPSGTIYSILNDSKGYLWFATDAGVSRFDGHSFTNFTLSDGLSDNEVIKIAEDSKGRIWLLGFSGTLCYYLRGKFFNPTNDAILKKARISGTYIHFFEDRKHRLWFSAYGGYTIVDSEKVEKLYSNLGLQGEGIVVSCGKGDVGIVAPEASVKKYSGLFVYADHEFIKHSVKYNRAVKSKPCYLPDGSVLFVSRERIIRQKDTTQQMILALGNEFANTKIYAGVLSSDSSLWIETSDKGVYRYDYNHLSAAPERYLNNSGIADLAEDKEHNIWIATFGDGAYMLPAGYKAVNNFYCVNYEKHSVYCVTKNKRGNIYTGHDDQTINVLKNGVTSALPFMKKKQQHANSRVTKLLIHEDDMWVGTDGYLARVDNFDRSTIKAKHLVHFVPIVTNMTSRIWSVKDLVWNNNNILVCDGGSIFIPDTPGHVNGLFKALAKPGRRYYCVYADKKGMIWYGANDGLYSNNGTEEVNHASESVYLSGSIYDIGETSDSVLALASYGNGLLLYKEGKVLQHLTEHDGLSSNLCKKVFVYRNNIYVATPAGATKISYTHGHVDFVKKFTTADGLLTNSVNDVYADDSEICFATQEGLTILNTRMPEIKIDAPPVYITRLTDRGRKLIQDSAYVFSYDQNALQFSFTAISYRLPGDVVYQYRLTDNETWMETKNTSIDFPYLAPGIYQFQLRAKIADGPWSGTQSFYFTIKPPFWKTYWFAAICAFAFIIAVILIARYQAGIRKRKESEQLKIKDQVAYLEQQALQAMMNPHFIFNVMNSIQHYINNNEKHEANLYLADFARLIRMNLDISSKRYIPLDDEVAYLELYLSLERIRFGKRLTYKIDIDPQLDGDETMIPVMLLQPFIENAVWHGILPKKENGHVQVDIKKEPDGMLKVRITDNGVGIPDPMENTGTRIKSHTSKGMKMTQQRLDLIGKITGHALYIHIQDAFPGENNKGTTVEFLLPGDLV